MMSYQEDAWGRDDWERDMNFTIRSVNNGRNQRKSRYSMAPDKDVPMACDRYKHSYNHTYLDDDTNSSVTSGSVLSESGKYSEMNYSLIDLDSFMYCEPPPTEVITRTPAINYDFSEYRGLVREILPSRRSQQDQDGNDWHNDIDLRTADISSLNLSERVYDAQIDDDTPLSAANNNKPRSPYLSEKEEDNDMSGLNFPDSMTHLPALLEQKKTNSLLQQASGSSSTRIPKSKNTESKFLSMAKRESDDDDVSEGLTIDDKEFNTASSSTALPQQSRSSKGKKPEKLPQQSISLKGKELTKLSQQSRSLKGKESAKLPQQSRSPKGKELEELPQQARSPKGKEPAKFVSRLARPAPVMTSTPSERLAALMQRAKKFKQPQIPIPSSSRQTSLPAANPSRQHEPDMGPSTSKAKSNTLHALTMKKSLVKPTSISTNERKSPSGYTLIARPKTKVTTRYCTRLDSIDNLNALPSGSTNARRDTFNSHTRQSFSAEPDRSSPINIQSATGPSTLREAVLHRRPNRPGGQNVSSNSREPIRPSIQSRPSAQALSSSPRASNAPSVLSKPSGPSRASRTTVPSRPSAPSRLTVPSGPSRSRNVQLIQPGEQNLRTEYNEMRYDESTHSWRGNEATSSDFLDRPVLRRRPMIISSGQGNAPSRYAAVVGNSMIFDPETRSWIASNGQEHSELDEIEDLQETVPTNSLSRGIYRNRHANDGTSHVLEIPDRRRAQFNDLQADHEEFMENWLGHFI